MLRSLVSIGLLGSAMFAQAPAPTPPTPPAPSVNAAPRTPAAPAPEATPATPTVPSDGLKQRPNIEPAADGLRVAPGTHILLNMINSVSTKQAAVGDRIYLETAFPILTNGRIVIPQGSWVTGTITDVKRPGRMKGHGELQVRFDSLTLPNGVSRDFRGDLGAIDARDDQKLKREDNAVSGAGNKKGDLGTVVGAATSGTVIGSGIGAAAGNWGQGGAIGAGAGATAALAGVLLTRGPDAILAKGSTVEMVLDRPLVFAENDLDLRNAPPHAPMSQGNTVVQQQDKGWTPRLPF